MRHELDSVPLGPRSGPMKHAVETCVHCGFCLPTCPTYDLLGHEADSPRGRIVLMKSVLEGTLDADMATPHLDRCLGCLACETSCPSGVRYGELLSSYRAETKPQTPRSISQRIQTLIASATLPYPTRLRPLLIAGRLARRFSWLTPRLLKPMISMVPDSLPPQQPTQTRYDAELPHRGDVAIHLGCVQRVMRPEIHQAAIRVLNRNGFTVHVLSTPSCCGALDWHIGNAEAAKRFAAGLCEAVPEGMPLVITAAGCGSTIREYPLVVADADDAVQASAQRVAENSLDISEFLLRSERRPATAVAPLRIAYHDACHLAHAQGVRLAPRQLLSEIAGVQLLEITDGHFCCGSAGLYNVQQPEIASELGRRKAARILEQKPDVVALGNIGCQVQIERYLRELGSEIPVLHTIEILDRAYRGVPILAAASGSRSSMPAALPATS